ncbi:TPA: hypothetical protein DIC40_04810 [Patescibacteria group bacterium]|nr:hypothetical protein [Candidatus Gracilibacteria bacterium]
MTILTTLATLHQTLTEDFKARLAAFHAPPENIHATSRTTDPNQTHALIHLSFVVKSLDAILLSNIAVQISYNQPTKGRRDTHKSPACHHISSHDSVQLAPSIANPNNIHQIINFQALVFFIKLSIPLLIFIVFVTKIECFSNFRISALVNLDNSNQAVHSALVIF